MKKIDEKVIDKWLTAIGKFSKDVKLLLGDRLESLYATEDPEIGVRDYNVVVVVKEPLDEELIDKIYEISAEACEEAGSEYAIVPKIVVKNTMEAEEYIYLLIQAHYSVRWKKSINVFGNRIKLLLGDRLESLYATEDPEIGVRDYNVVVVVKEPLDEELIDKIYEISAEACEEAGSEYAIVPKIVVKNTMEAEEYVRILEKIGGKIL